MSLCQKGFLIALDFYLQTCYYGVNKSRSTTFLNILTIEGLMNYWRILRYLQIGLLFLFLYGNYSLIAYAEETSDAVTATEETTEATIGDLVKSEDSSAVYYWADDGERYAFPNENVYFSWYGDFDEVKEVSSDDLASISFGGLVDYQAGTSLVKMPSVNTVYAVEPDGILRAIESEEDAEALYGEDWAEQVDDLSEAFFPRYEVGEAIDVTSGELPEGYLMQDEDGDLCRVDSTGSCVEIDDAISEELEALYEQYAEDYETVAERMEEAFGTEISFEDFDVSILESILRELSSALDPVFIEESLRIATEMYDLYSLEVFNEGEWEDGEWDDEDGDHMKDYWDDVYDEWLEEGEGDEDWFESYYEEWIEEGYADYYNEYYDYFAESGEDVEYDYEDWSDYFGESSDWSSDEDGFYYTDESGEVIYYDESADSDFTSEDDSEGDDSEEYDSGDSSSSDSSGSSE